MTKELTGVEYKKYTRINTKGCAFVLHSETLDPIPKAGRPAVTALAPRHA